VQERIDAHFDAGASHVCIQPVNPTGNIFEVDMSALEKLAPSAN